MTKRKKCPGIAYLNTMVDFMVWEELKQKAKERQTKKNESVTNCNLLDIEEEKPNAT